MKKTDTAKPEARGTARHTRQQLYNKQGDIGVAIAQHFERQFGETLVGSAAGYWPHGSEANCLPTLGLLDRLGWDCALPVVDAKNYSLAFRRWTDGDLVSPNEFGIPEPMEDAKLVFPDMVLVPLLAFDLTGHRLGTGGGFYDRTLEQLRSKGNIMAIGIGYAGQQVAEWVPEPHDERLDAMVTETGVMTFSQDLEI